MAYTDDAVKAKLSALNETQEGIVTVAQWVMFHRRHAERTAQLWLQKLRDSPAPKRLNLIYLANGRAAVKSTSEGGFPHLILSSQYQFDDNRELRANAWKVIAEATATAYKGSSNEIQQKIRRVVEVWRQRSIFEAPIQEAVEGRIDDIDRSRSTGKKPLLGGSLFSNSAGSTPSELQPLVPLQTALSKATMVSGTPASTANAEYEKMHDPNTPLPTPPVHAARLSQLLKTLANAESSVSEVIKSRHALIDGLEKLLETNRSALSQEQSLATQLSERRAETETKKRDVEDGIMRGLSAENMPTAHPGDNAVEGGTVARPEVEALTPPPVESITPIGSPKQEPQDNYPASTAQGPSPFVLPGFEQQTGFPLHGTDLPGLSTAFTQDQLDGLNEANPKRQKVAHGEEDYAQFAGGDLDADVAQLLEQEGNGQG